MADINLIVATNADKVTSEFNRLGNTVLSQVKKAQQLERGYKDLDRAFNKGQISAQKYSRGIVEVDNAIKQALTGQAQLATATRRTAGAMDTMGAAQAVSTRRMGRGSVITQQAGYQVGDFLVQIQSGTNAMVAFGQQATQIAGTMTILGGKWVLIGSALGIIIPLVTALGAAFMRTGTDASFLGDSLATISPVLDALARAANWAKEAFFDMANVIVNNFDRMIVYGLAFSGFIASKFVAGFVLAKVATMGLVGSLLLLKAALIRTGIGALVVGAGELVYQFVRLVKGAGGFGQAMILVKAAALEAFQRMGQQGLLFGQQVKAVYNGLKYDALIWLNALSYQFSKTMDDIAKGMNTVFGTSFDTGRVATLVSELTPEVIAIREEASSTAATIVALRAELDKPWTSMEDLNNALGETTKDIDVRDWDLFGGKDDDKDKGSESALEKLRKELALMEELVGKTQEYRYVREALGDEYKNVSAETIAGLEAQYKAVQELIRLEEEHKANLQSVADVMKSSMSDAFTSMVEGTKTVGDAFKEMARLIIKQLFDVLVVQKLVGSFNVGTGTGSGIVGAIMGIFQADGGAWNKGVQMFADGGVVNSPTMFGHSGGVGVMGEAGPEAILPLKRGANGKLGVQMEGGSSQPVVINQSFNFSANGDESVKKIIAQAAPQIAQMTQKSMMDQRRRGGSMKSTFG